MSAMAAGPAFLLGQISDMHVRRPGELCYGRVDTAAFLQRAVAQLLALPQRPDVLAITGDLVDGGSAEEYAVLRELLAPLPMPYYLIPGNHDDPAALSRAFADHSWMRTLPPFVQYAIEDWPLRIVAIDTVIPGAPGGRLCERRLAWLDATLGARPGAPTVVLMHHPPFASFIGHMDAMGLENPQALAAVIARHPQVERLLCGHLHRPIQARFAGTLASTCPSTAHQIALDLAPHAADGFVLEPPGFLLHAWSPEVGLISHGAVIGDYAGPFPFGD